MAWEAVCEAGERCAMTAPSVLTAAQSNRPVEHSSRRSQPAHPTIHRHQKKEGADLELLVVFHICALQPALQQVGRQAGGSRRRIHEQSSRRVLLC